MKQFGRKWECSKPKLTVCGVLRRCKDFDENLTRTRLRHVYEAKGEAGFGHEGSSLLDGSHYFLRTTNSFASASYIPLNAMRKGIYNPLSIIPIPYQFAN